MPLRKNKTSRTKYIFVSGGVISGIGKGITAASISLLLKSTGLKVAPIKLEGYLNIDAGTINPIEHGDPFLCEDGTETDMDIGTYEKFLDEDMGKDNFVTMGRIYQEIIAKERRFEYNGEDVEAVHICNAIIDKIQYLANKKKADVVTIELGGTVGEYWNVFFYEASRILSLKNPGDVIHVHVSYLPTPDHLGEPKTKPTQLSVRTLNSLGIIPDFLVARSEKFIDTRRRDRFALFCNMLGEDIISNPDVASVYEVPLVLEEQGMSSKIQKKLGLKIVKPNLTSWRKLVAKTKSKKKKTIEIAIVGKYFGTGDYQLKDSYAALFDAINHAGWEADVEIVTRWVDSEKLEKEGALKVIGNPDGIIVPIGWGERGSGGMIAAAAYAIEKKIPYLGLCYGMQLAAVAFARKVLNWKDADTTENNSKTGHSVIHLIKDQEKLMELRAYGGTMRLGGWDAIVKKGTIAWNAYDKFKQFKDKSRGLTSERHRHRYEFNGDYAEDFEKKGMIISGKSVVENLVEIIELDKKLHPFFLGTQGHPEYKSRPGKPHPLFVEFLKASSK